MKKMIMFLMGVMMVLSLAACAPTSEKKDASTAAVSGTDDKVQMETGGASDKVPDPNVVPEDQVLIYFPNEDGTKLSSKMDSVPELGAQAVVDKLVEYGVLEEGTQVLNFDTADETGTLNISQIPSENKKMVIAAVEQTFMDNFELLDATLQVNGEKAGE